MAKKFYVRLTVDFRDGTSVDTIAEITEAVALDRALKNGDPLPGYGDEVVDISYTTLREFPDADH